jgi:hypothetical protein
MMNKFHMRIPKRRRKWWLEDRVTTERIALHFILMLLKVLNDTKSAYLLAFKGDFEMPHKLGTERMRYIMSLKATFEGFCREQG